MGYLNYNYAKIDTTDSWKSMIMLLSEDESENNCWVAQQKIGKQIPKDTI